MSEDKEQKTEDATDKKKSDERAKGRFVQSKEVTSAFTMLSIMITLYFTGVYMAENLMRFMRKSLSTVSETELTPLSIIPVMKGMVEAVVTTVGPLAIVIIVSVFTINIMQGGGIVFSGEALTLKLSKVNPLKGINKIISKNALAELFKSILKIAIVGTIAYKTVRSEFENIPSLMHMEGVTVLQYICWISLKIAFFSFLALLVLALIDYIFQKYTFEEGLKMTKQEIKDERKNSEGDPAVKARIRNLQMEASRRRMMEAVPTADVVITNPTHFAIAIKYEGNIMAAPVVVAKGTGFLAQKIKKIAEESGVPLFENKPVAQALYKTVDIGAPVPVTLYKAVAEILAYVYRLKGKT